MRGEAEALAIQLRLRFVADQPQRAGRVGEVAVEIRRRQVERGGKHRQQPMREALHGREIRHGRGAELRQRGRPLVQPHHRVAGQDLRIIRRAIAHDVEALVAVGPLVGVHGRCADGLRALRQVADVDVADLERELLLHRQVEETRGGGEGVGHHAVRHAVVGQHQEAGVAAGPRDVARQFLPRAGRAGEVGAEVEHRDAPLGAGDVGVLGARAHGYPSRRSGEPSTARRGAQRDRGAGRRRLRQTAPSISAPVLRPRPGSSVLV